VSGHIGFGILFVRAIEWVKEILGTSQRLDRRGDWSRFASFLRRLIGFRRGFGRDVDSGFLSRTVIVLGFARRPGRSFLWGWFIFVVVRHFGFRSLIQAFLHFTNMIQPTKIQRARQIIIRSALRRSSAFSTPPRRNIIFCTGVFHADLHANIWVISMDGHVLKPILPLFLLIVPIASGCTAQPFDMAVSYQAIERHDIEEAASIAHVDFSHPIEGQESLFIPDPEPGETELYVYPFGLTVEIDSMDAGPSLILACGEDHILLERGPSLRRFPLRSAPLHLRGRRVGGPAFLD